MPTVMVQDERTWPDVKGKQVVLTWRGKAGEYNGEDLARRQREIEEREKKERPRGS